jgi:hypothetical protein
MPNFTVRALRWMRKSKGLFVVVGDQGADDGLAGGGAVVPDGGGQARMRYKILAVTPSMVRPPWRSRSSWPLRASLTGSVRWRSGLNSVGQRLAGPGSLGFS